MYGEDGSEGPKGTFEIYRAEADSLYKQGEYKKAIDSYTQALELTPGERNTLVCRSKCHLQLGDMKSALKDAEASLQEDKNYHRGIYQKAQALYYQGDFEMALVFYHRGHKLRPELQEFRLGIQKAQEAIDNSIGCKSTETVFANFPRTIPTNKVTVLKIATSLSSRKTSEWDLQKVLTSVTTKSLPIPGPSSDSSSSTPITNRRVVHKPAPETVKLTTDGDLSYFEHMQDDKKINKRSPGQAVTNSYQKAPQPHAAVSSEKTIKQLLGELYGDRQYLEKLLKETDPASELGKSISSLVTEGLSYLDTRSDFWRQQKPMYARRYDRMMQRRRREGSSVKVLPNDYIIRELEKIDQAQVDGRYQEALRRSQKCLSIVQDFNEEDVPNKIEVIANLHSCIGNAHLELGAYDKALNSHQTDLNMGESNDMVEAVSRGLDNIGRVYARMGDFAQAIDVWERKLPMSNSSLESTWLYHEIGRCYLELDKYLEAKSNGERSETAAIEANDKMWQLQALVLTAQAEVKLAELQAAVTTFEKASELAREQGDKSAAAAIKKAVDEINAKIIAEGIDAEKEEQTERRNTSENESQTVEKKTVEFKEDDSKTTEEKPKSKTPSPRKEPQDTADDLPNSPETPPLEDTKDTY